jgi:hypothetical protein
MVVEAPTLVALAPGFNEIVPAESVELVPVLIKTLPLDASDEPVLMETSPDALPDPSAVDTDTLELPLTVTEPPLSPVPDDNRTDPPTLSPEPPKTAIDPA